MCLGWRWWRFSSRLLQNWQWSEIKGYDKSFHHILQTGCKTVVVKTHKKYVPAGVTVGDHFRGSLFGYNSTVMIAGGINSTDGTVEILRNNKWSVIASDKRLRIVFKDRTVLDLKVPETKDSNLWDATPITWNNITYFFGGFKCEVYTKEDPCNTNPSYNWRVLMMDNRTLKFSWHPQKLKTERWFARSILAGFVL